MDLLDENRSLIHSGKLLRQPESGLEWSGLSELYVLLFDNYRALHHSFFLNHHSHLLLVVLTKPKERDGVTKYHVNRRVRIIPPYF